MDVIEITNLIVILNRQVFELRLIALIEKQQPNVARSAVVEAKHSALSKLEEVCLCCKKLEAVSNRKVGSFLDESGSYIPFQL